MLCSFAFEGAIAFSMCELVVGYPVIFFRFNKHDIVATARKLIHIFYNFIILFRIVCLPANMNLGKIKSGKFGHLCGSLKLIEIKCSLFNFENHLFEF